MRGRPKEYDDNEVIDKAIEVFQAKNYDAASADELLAAMGIGKGSFYLNFKGGKKELYEKSIGRYAEKLNKKIEREMDSSDDTLAYLKRLFLAMANASSASKDRGCYFGNALVQLPVEEKETKALAASYLTQLHGIFAKGIRKAQENGQLSKTKDVETLAWFLSNLWNGLQVTRRMEKSPQRLKELVELNFNLLT